jgi:hypothetical protein
MREASVGNFTRMAGSASLLAGSLATTGTSVGARATQLLTMVGVLKVTQDAELAEAATQAAASAASVEAYAQRAAGAIAAADTELALAEASVRVATTAEAEAAAQVELAAAYEAVLAAATGATVAEDALAVAQGRAAETAAASAAATTIGFGPMAGVLAAVAVGALLVASSFRDANSEVDKAVGKLQKHAREADIDAQAQKAFAQTLDGVEAAIRAVNEALDKLENKTRTTAEQELKAAAAALALANSHRIAAVAALAHAKAEESLAFAMNTGSAGGVMLQGQAAEDRIAAAQKFLDTSTAAITAAGTALERAQSFVSVERGSADAADKIKHKYDGLIESTRLHYLAQHKVGDELERQVGLLKKQEDAELDALKKPKKPRKESDHGLANSLDDLDAQIRGQIALAAAYQVSDAQAIKAEAQQRAEEEAIRHKGKIALYFENEIALAIATRAAEGAKLIADLRFEADSRAAVNNQVAAGIIPATQAGQALELEAKLRPLTAAAAVAEGQAKANLVDIIRNLTGAYENNNAEIARGEVLAASHSGQDQLDKLRAEAQLIGETNLVRATTIAQLEAEQFLRAHPGASPNEEQAYIATQVKIARLTANNVIAITHP